MDCQGSLPPPFFFNNLNSLEFSLTILGGNTGFPLPNEVGCFPSCQVTQAIFFQQTQAYIPTSSF